jgi:hypothetical protein
MPYQNQYNQHIASEMDAINHRFATQYAYSPVDGHGMSGGSNAGVLFQTASASKRDGEDNMYNNSRQLPEVYYYGNDSEGMAGGSAFAGGTFRDTGEGSQLGIVGSGASGEFDKVNVYGGANAMMGCGMEGGTFWDTLGDIGNTALKFAPLLLALGKPMEGGSHGMEVGKAFKDVLTAEGMSGGSFWDDFIKGVGDVADVAGKVAPIAMKIFGVGKRKKGGNVAMAEIAPVGGAILGNPDPYPVQGNSVRKAGRGRKKGGANAVVGGEMVNKNGDLLAMSNPDLKNGVPPTAQLQGSYGGSKHSKKDKKVIAEVEKMLGQGEKKILPGACLKTGDGRKARAEIVKAYMKKHGCKMIEASRKVKELGLYKK